MDEGIFSPLHRGVIMVEGFYNLRKNKFVVGRTNHVLWAYVMRISMMLTKSIVGLVRLVMMKQIDLYRRYSSEEGEEGNLGRTLFNFRNGMEMINNSNFLVRDKCQWWGIECDLVDDVGVFVTKGHVIICHQWDAILDDQFGEDHVGLCILYFLNNILTIMTIWKW